MSDSASINATARTISKYIVSQYGLRRFLHFMHDLGGPGQRADFSSAQWLKYNFKDGGTVKTAGPQHFFCGPH